MPKPELEFFPVDSLPFKPVPGAPPGHVERILTEDPEKMMVTRIMRVPPHSNNPQTFVHDFWEEVYILEGRQWVGDKLYTKGMYACRPPGNDARTFSYRRRALHNPRVSLREVTSFAAARTNAIRADRVGLFGHGKSLHSIISSAAPGGRRSRAISREEV